MSQKSIKTVGAIFRDVEHLSSSFEFARIEISFFSGHFVRFIRPCGEPKSTPLQACSRPYGPVLVPVSWGLFSTANKRGSVNVTINVPTSVSVSAFRLLVRRRTA